MKARTKKAIFVLIVLAISSNTNAFQMIQCHNQVPVKCDRQFFIENKGQWPEEILYLTRLNGLDVWITKKGVNYTFYKLDKDTKTPKQRNYEYLPQGKFGHIPESYILLGHRVIADHVDANSNPILEGKQKLEGYYNYLIGNDTSKHATYVGLYKEAMVKNVYDGIDIRYYFDCGALRYDYVVQPGADPSQIQFRLRGQYNSYLKGRDLVFTTSFGEVQMSDLRTFQNNEIIASSFVKKGDTWQITVGKYDKNSQLIIDPLIYSTYLGGYGSELGYSIAVDDSGNAYVTGETSSTNFDITPGAYQTSYTIGNSDIFVTKLNSTGTVLIYSTFLGGSNSDRGNSIAVDASGNAYITGNTSSNDFDITSGAFQTSLGGTSFYEDVIVTKLNSTGSALIYSTYLGGSGSDIGWSIAVDATGNAYVTGQTSIDPSLDSNDFDITSGAYQTVYAMSNSDVFITKLNNTGAALLYSTYLGGSGIDVGRSIAIDAFGNAYITGFTNSSDFDITSGAFQSSWGGTSSYFDVFVTKLNSTGTTLIYSTYLGGSNSDSGYSIAVDVNGNAYVTGNTSSNDFDITSGAFQTSYDYYDVFVTKLNSTGTALVYSTYLGGGGIDNSYAIAVDGIGNAYFTGNTASNGFSTQGAFQTIIDGDDVFIAKLNSTGTSLIYFTYLGGDDVQDAGDYGTSIFVDTNGNVFVTGYTCTPDFDITSGAFQTGFGGICDAFITKLDLSETTNIDIVDSHVTSNLFSLHPHPASILLNISAGEVSPQTIAIYNLSGEKLCEQTFNPQIDISQLIAGMYVIELKTEGAIGRKRFVKM